MVHPPEGRIEIGPTLRDGAAEDRLGCEVTAVIGRLEALADLERKASRLVEDLVGLFAIETCEFAKERRERSSGEIRASVEGLAVRGEPHAHRPAAAAGEHLDGLQ